MADRKVEPLFKLPPETVRKLTSAKDDIEKSRRALVSMKEMGMDVKDLEDRLNWAEGVQKTLLRDFA